MPRDIKGYKQGEVIPMPTAEALRYNERSTAERTNGRLKEEFGGKHIMVRGHAKVTLHLMFGIIALFADQLLRLISQAVLFYSLSCHPREGCVKNEERKEENADNDLHGCF